MYEIVAEIRFRNYVLLSLDRPIEEKAYDLIEIEGKRYDIVPSYDIPGIAIESEDSFVGKKARLVLSDRFRSCSNDRKRNE